MNNAIVNLVAYFLVSVLGLVALGAYGTANMVHLEVRRKSKSLDHFMTKHSFSNVSVNSVMYAALV